MVIHYCNGYNCLFYDWNILKGDGVPKKNQYVIMNKKDNTFYHIRRSFTDDFWGGINVAMGFEEDELNDQKKMLVRNTEHYEVIFKINNEGNLVLIY